MIYSNFLIFISALFLFAIGPTVIQGGEAPLPPIIKLYGIAVALLVFWQFNKYKFMKLKDALKSEQITISEAKKAYMRTTNAHMILAILTFAIEIFLFDFKYFLIQIPFFGRIETVVNIGGIVFFILHLAMIWHWAYRALGDVIFIGKSAADHVRANIKFNLVIVIPWLAILILTDLIAAFSPMSVILLLYSPLVHLLLFGFFIVILAIFTPIFITWLWDCRPLEDTEMKNEIDAFCRSQGVKFKHIMSWNALNGGLVTAGVLGLVSPFRYLLITPELKTLLNKDELMAVVSHEVGHVKKKHLLLYLVFFLVFMFIVTSLVQFTNIFIPLGTTAQDETAYDLLGNIIPIVLFLSLFVLYFRFIFGFFMRNFEREADTYCFRAGIDPNFMISSFEKLELHLGGEEKKSNWHHYSIPQRVGFIKTCMDNPDHIVRHKKKLNRSLRVFLVLSAILVIFSSYFFINVPSPLDQLKQQIENDPNNPDLYRVLGDINYSLERWAEAKKAYDNCLHLKYQQPDILNNLAWLLLKCPDETVLDAKRALKLAQDAAVMDKRSFYIMDTLAEAYFQNAMYKEAFLAAQRAFVMATENKDYYKKQVEKMAKFYKTFKSAVNI